MTTRPKLDVRTLDELTIEDESSFRHVALYADLKSVLVASRYPFRVMPEGSTGHWNRAVFLNLTYWGGGGGDVLVDENLPADVVTHVAWHHLAERVRRAGGGESTPPSADALFLGEAIASAFDLYLVGRLLGHAPGSSFLETQVPAMADCAAAAGMSDEGFEELLEGIAKDPERAFEDLRELLFDATTALVACGDVDDAFATLSRFDSHRFAALLHHYELSNWVLYARAYAGGALGPDPRVRAVDASLREASVALDWLVRQWLTPALSAGGSSASA